MNIFLKILLGLGAIALLVALAGMYKFNILEDGIYTKDKDLWISAVLIKPKTFDEATSREEIYNSMKGQWDNPQRTVDKVPKSTAS